MARLLMYCCSASRPMTSSMLSNIVRADANTRPLATPTRRATVLFPHPELVAEPREGGRRAGHRAPGGAPAVEQIAERHGRAVEKLDPPADGGQHRADAGQVPDADVAEQGRTSHAACDQR